MCLPLVHIVASSEISCCIGNLLIGAVVQSNISFASQQKTVFNFAQVLPDPRLFVEALKDAQILLDSCLLL